MFSAFNPGITVAAAATAAGTIFTLRTASMDDSNTLATPLPGERAKRCSKVKSLKKITNLLRFG